MKSYEELTMEILDKAKAEKRARRKRIITASSSVAALCLVLSASLVGAHLAGAFTRDTITKPEVGSSISAAEKYSEVYAMLEIDRETVLDKVLNKVDRLFGVNKEFVADEMMTNEQNSLKGELALPEGENGASANDSDMRDDTSDSTKEHSDTNVQVAGIMEADVVKTDGEYVYVLSFNKLYIVSVDNGEIEKISETEYYSKETDEKAKTDNYHSVIHNSEMYVRGDRLIIVYTTDTYGYSSKTVADVYDISEKSAPEKISSLGISGVYHASRMNGEKLYLTSTEVFNDDSIKKSSPDTYVPSRFENGEEDVVDVNDVYCGNQRSTCRYLNVCEIDTDSLEITSQIALLGFGSGEIYQSASNLYAARSIYGVKENGSELTKTLIAKVSLSDGLRFVADASVDGTILNSFSMDEKDGYFRLVTSVNKSVVSSSKNDIVSFQRWSRYNNLYVLDEELKISGMIEGLAEDERIYSARFDGDIAYFVTYRETDPLFCADLSDPEAPVILSELKIPGFSEYLHKFGSDLLFGLGKTDEGYLKMSMFDVSDKTNVTEKNVNVIHGEYYSEACSDHHAILVDYGKNLISFPGQYFYVYSFVNGFFQKQAQLDYEMGQHGYSWSARSLYVGEYFYVVTPFGIDSYTLDGFEKVSSAALGNAAENPYGYTFYCD